MFSVVYRFGIKLGEVKMGKVEFRFAAAVLLMVLLALAMPFMAGAVYAANPQFETEASTNKAAFYLGEQVTISYKAEWTDAAGLTLNVELWNSTAKIQDLGNFSTGSNVNGSYSANFNVNGLTSKVGSYSYVVKTLEANTGLTVATASIKVVVQDKSISLSVAWDDATGDRKVDPSEQVTFTCFVNWAFVNQSINAVLKVNDQGYEKIIDSITISAGSGSAQKTYITSFETAGVKTVTFILEDSAGKVLASKAVSIQVGSALTSTAPAGASIMDQINSWVNANIGLMALMMVFCVIAILVLVWKRS